MKLKNGFTLIEILLAMGIFIVGVLAIINVFPKATGDMLKSENDNIAAAFADSLMGALSAGARQYKGVKAAAAGDNHNPEDVVWFTFELDDAEQDFFVLPFGTDIMWYPQVNRPTNTNTPAYSVYLADNFVSQGRVRQMGRAALGSSILAFDIANTEDDNPERLKQFYFCFNVQLEPGFTNLYHFVLFIYHDGVRKGVAADANSTTNTYHLLEHASFIDNSTPANTGDAVSPANNFIQRFDFLLKI